MAHRHVAEGVRDKFAVAGEKLHLSERVGVILRVVGYRKVGIYRFHADRAVPLQVGQQLVQFGAHKAQPVHPGIQLQVYGILAYMLVAQYLNQGLESIEIRYSRFEVVIDYVVEGVAACGQHQYRGHYAVLAEFDSLHRVGHCQIVSPRIAHHLCELHGSVTVGVGLHEHEHFGFRTQSGPEISVVLKAVGEFELQPGKFVFSESVCHIG